MLSSVDGGYMGHQTKKRRKVASQNGHTGEWPHVVIIGAGFAGLEAAKRLSREPFRITIIDKANHHLFQPLLYQVATAALPATDISAPIRKIFRSCDNVEVILDEALAIYPGLNQVHCVRRDYPYDYLLLAAGAKHTYFGHDEWEKYAPGLKTVKDAFEIRRRVLMAFENAEQESDDEKRREWLRFVIVGGGPTGVELAGAIAEIARVTLAKDFRNFDPRATTVHLIEMHPQILVTYPEALRTKARLQLEKLGVTVHTGERVVEVGQSGVQTENFNLDAKTVLWAAGMVGSPIAQFCGAQLHPSGRILVESSLHVPGHPNFFVAGDLAFLASSRGVIPAVAPAAIQEGKLVAQNISRAHRDMPLLPFTYRDRGALATIGRRAAVGTLGRFQLSGFVAWLAWLAVHAVYLVGFRNRVSVVFEWAWSYFTKQRMARVILTENGREAMPAMAGSTAEGRSSTVSAEHS